MRLETIAIKILPNFVLAKLGVNFGIGKFAFDQKLDIKADINQKYGFSGDILDLYLNNKNQVVHKWHHYIPIYDKYFARFRGRKIRFLEIGVSKGGSLQMWRKYFGDEAIIFGIDIDPNCAQFNGQAGQVRIGSQDDPIFLESVITEMGGVDLILDDGSHHMDQIEATLNYLFPKLSNGGAYMIEDLHTAYWKNFGGGYRSKSNFFSFIADLIDDIHHWYHLNKVKHPSISNSCASIHIHDSIVVIEKDHVFEPTHSQIS